MSLVGYANADPTKDTMFAVVAMNGSASSAPATADAVPPDMICLLQGDDTGNLPVDWIHESVGVGKFVNGKFKITVAWSFGVNAQNNNPQFYPKKSKWLWWVMNTPAGSFIPGNVYKADGFYNTIVSEKIVTQAQENTWRSMMISHAAGNGMTDKYKVGQFDCTTFSNKVFADAPGILN